MLEPTLEKAATGLAFIIPGILLVRWYLTRKTGSPEQWVEEQIRELERRFARGEIDEATYNQRLHEMRDA
ncbi:MAG: SHOCT domain-containing protein [Gammaproteobacteria bacterium]|nr:SHOCT domain-containing protein [Gammaproteobacteria bacterium]